MWTCVSERQLRRETAVAAGLLGLAAAWFWFRQSQPGAAGGAIAWPKAAWLFYAIFAWFLLPVLLARDRRETPQARRIYRLFFVNMAARGGIEVAMMYFWRNWHPYYGAAHDVASIALLAWLARDVRRGLYLTHAGVTAGMLAAETSFALYFAAHFHTQGAQALFFVPDQERYSTILMATSLTVAALTVYWPVFLWRWLGHGEFET